MKKLITILCCALFIVSCGKNDDPKRELIISAHGILSGGKFVYLDESEGIIKHGYSVYLHKGNIEVTNSVIENPASGSYKSSQGIFCEVVEDGEYTVIVKVSYVRNGAFGSSNYSGTAYTVIKYPEPDLGKTFKFNWDKETPTYVEDGITYINLK